MKIINYLKNPSLILLYLMNKGCFKFVNDEKYVKLKYRLEIGKKINLENPTKYSEKLQWLKLYDHKDIYTSMVDKYESKNVIRKLVGEEYVIKTYGIYNYFDEIDFEKLPNKFIIKTTHGCGGCIPVLNKENLNKKEAKKVLEKSLKQNYFYLHREWAYKNVKPRIIVEELLENDDKTDLLEYNLFCLNGKTRMILVCYGDKRYNRYNDYYDENLQKMDMKIRYKTSENIHKFPKEIKKMKELAENISQGIPNLRVDFYYCNGKIYIGELTFFHWAGFLEFTPESWDYKLGEMLDLSGVNKK